MRDENDITQSRVKNVSLVTLEPLEQRSLHTDNIQVSNPEKEEDFSFQKLRGRALELERKVMESSGSRTPIKNVCNKKSIANSTKQQEDFSFQALREKALKLEKRALADPRVEDLSNRKEISRLDEQKTNPVSLDKKRSEPTSTPTKKTDIGPNGKESYTPNRLNKYYKQRIKKEEVEATDMSHASVQKLSQWLAEKPFEKHKKPVVTRKGVHIVNKARVFEKDYTATVLEEINKQYFPSGKVSKGKQWLEKAFKNTDDNDESNSEESEQIHVSDKAKLFENAFKASKRRTTMCVDTRALYGIKSPDK
jgi:hypothetical protein